MTLASTDITAFFTGNGGALLDRDNNLGGDIGVNEIVTSLLYNFVPDVDRDIVGAIGSPAGLWTIYAPFYIYNKSPDTPVTNVKIWIYRAPSDPNVGVSIGFDPVGRNGIMQTIANKQAAPHNVTFKSPFTQNSTSILAIPLLDAGDKYGVWVKVFGNKGMASIAQASFGIMWSFDRPA